jgi:hypothetical protein
LLGGGSSRPTPTAKESLGREHKPMVILVGAEGDLGPNQHQDPLPGKTKPEPQYQAPPTPQYLPMPAPEYRQAPVPKPIAPTPSPTPFGACIAQNLLNQQGVSVATVCLSMTVVCAARGIPRACLGILPTCGYGLGVGAYCYSQSLGNNPSPLPPFPPVEEGE